MLQVNARNIPKVILGKKCATFLDTKFFNFSFIRILKNRDFSSNERHCIVRYFIRRRKEVALEFF